jgi:hypothetical protein
MSETCREGAGRFVVLEHTRNGVHWDFMIEEGGVLRTWALEAPPEAGRDIPARQLVDHRLEYLTYEGPISGDRGTVRRVAEGTYRTLASEDGRLILRLAGDQLVGTLDLYSSGSGESSSACSGWTFWLGKAD